jgi:zinc protease
MRFRPLAGLTPVASSPTTMGGPDVTSFTLDNGLEVVVIPDRRVPVVTHMVWYRNGSADDPPLKSGIAHFLEHLMFKGTDKHPAGEFSQAVASLGGQENAFTSYDYTAYFQRVAKEHLGTMMEFEADRMGGLSFDEALVGPERDVVLEERRMRVETDPGAQLSEALSAALYVHHPYGTPIIGWMHEIEGLTRDDALAYYRRFYTPENAILVVAGDIGAEEVRALAEETYGRIAARGARPERRRPREPDLNASRRVTVADEKVEQPYLQQAFLVPSSRTQEGSESYALELLGEILGGGQTSVLYRNLVLEKEVAVSAGAYYYGTMLDAAHFGIHAAPRPGVTLEALEAAIGEAVAQFLTRGVAIEELERAKTRFVAEMIYAQDSQAHLARLYGSSLAIGESVEDVVLWPQRIEAVTADEIRAVGERYILKGRPVSGYLEPRRA